MEGRGVTGFSKRKYRQKTSGTDTDYTGGGGVSTRGHGDPDDPGSSPTA